jgi:glycosyltransferase involved in cell wall biosynthesis
MSNPALETATPLVSVIIPCFNHGVFLSEAITSVQQQQYPKVEIIVVDDGSTDNTATVATQHSLVRYIHQAHQGVSIARNTGIVHSNGACLVFLDADDWLLPGALAYNAEHLLANPSLAFVSGGYLKVFNATGETQRKGQEVTTDHYTELLLGNYISMHATVMYQRWVFDAFDFDSGLRGCEDYELYLRIARRYPVAHHTHPLAAYRHHGNNTSADIPLMLSTAITVLERQRPYLRTTAEQQARSQGQRNWKEFYIRMLYQRLRDASPKATPAELVLLAREKPLLALTYFLHPLETMFKRLLKRLAPSAWLRGMQQAGLYRGYLPAVGRVALGDFGRVTPFSTGFGYDRGGPIDRYYIEAFLQKEATAIRGRVMEVGDNEYTLRFGQEVTHSDILHVDPANEKATIIADLSAAPQIVDNLFDCIILTQTLHLIYDYKQALATCFRILKPGGTLLLTVPGLTPIDKGEWKESWYWSFTDKALQRLLGDTFPAPETEINSFGNVFIASTFLYGMGVAEVTIEQLNHYDPQFQVINTVKAIKPRAHV